MQINTIQTGVRIWLPLRHERHILIRSLAACRSRHSGLKVFDKKGKCSCLKLRIMPIYFNRAVLRPYAHFAGLFNFEMDGEPLG